MSKPDTPKPPDYVGAAQAQGGANIDAALAGTALATPNQVNPFGTTSWSNPGYDQAMADWMAGQPGGGSASGTGAYDPGAPNSNAGPQSVGDFYQNTFGTNVHPSLGQLTSNPVGSISDSIGEHFRRDTGITALTNTQSLFGKGDNGSAPSYTPSPEETAYNNWLSSRPDKKNFNSPGDWTLSTQFSPELQKLFDRTGSDPLAPADLGAGAEANRQTASDAVYGRATRYLDPQVAQARTALQAQLHDQGIYPGSEAYAYQMDQFEKQTGTSYADARDRAITLGGAEADRTFHENQQTWLQRLQERELPFQEYGTLKGLLPSANPSAQSVQPSPILDAIKQQYGAALNQYGIDAGQAGSQNAAGASILAAIVTALACDPALKTDVRPAEPVLDKLEKVHIHHFRYKPEVPGVGTGGMVFTGPMADEWAAQFGGDGKKIELLSVLGVIMKGMQELRAEIRSLKAGG